MKTETQPVRSSTVKPGEAMVSVISANQGGVAEKILIAMSKGIVSDQFEATFSASHLGRWNGVVYLKDNGQRNGKSRAVTLILNEREGLFLQDLDDVCSCSMKDIRHENGIWVIGVGQYARVSPQKWNAGARKLYTSARIDSLARNLIGTWILHGRDWVDRSNVCQSLPYGVDESRVSRHRRQGEDNYSSISLGKIVERKGPHIQSSLCPFLTFQDYQAVYPEVLCLALCNLYAEYNRSFASLVRANHEWDTDYQYCAQDGQPANCCVQVDVAGLDEATLVKIGGMSEPSVREMLRRRIFEIENSIAMYQILGRCFPGGIDYMSVLDDLRNRFKKPIALLAVTDEKYEAMRSIEFGKTCDQVLTAEEIRERTGFDAFWGPAEFLRHLSINNHECRYLLYVRSSDPVAKLRNPEVSVLHPLLGRSDVRRVIKANAITFNIDAPGMEFGRRINDTKEYLFPMGMGFPVYSVSDLDSKEFMEYCQSVGVDAQNIKTTGFRAKPAKGTYGCYGHMVGVPGDGEFLRELRGSIRQRGPYVFQKEVQTPIVTNSCDGQSFTYIDRVFLGMVGGQARFLGGLRNFMPLSTNEAKNARVHGNSLAVYCKITS